MELNINDEYEVEEIDYVNKKKQTEQNENTDLDMDDIEPQPVNNSFSGENITKDESPKLSWFINNLYRISMAFKCEYSERFVLNVTSINL